MGVHRAYRADRAYRVYRVCFMGVFRVYRVSCLLGVEGLGLKGLEREAKALEGPYLGSPSAPGPC